MHSSQRPHPAPGAAPKTGIGSNALPCNEFREGLGELTEAESAVIYQRPHLLGMVASVSVFQLMVFLCRFSVPMIQKSHIP